MFFFFFNNTAPPEIYTLSLHDALPIFLKIALAQLNPIVGDVAGNEQKAREARAEAARLGADIVMFAEHFLAGYPAEDLVLKDRKSTRLNSSHANISYAVFCLKKKKNHK